MRPVIGHMAEEGSLITREAVGAIAASRQEPAQRAPSAGLSSSLLLVIVSLVELALQFSHLCNYMIWSHPLHSV
jgi:hypothetical protein